ncbi:DNA topoisomerase 2-alpha [Trichinella spiralis]|uniref:DNA topoisomerase 2-alpha n=1 Tax=Trichinella spiralis TaxID=6334 RepID=UPI0001EFB6C9|nr:DNA topoisomerase 2-alpha [Trichinella spiralis]
MFKIILYALKVYSNHSKEERLTFLLESFRKKSVSFFSELENWNTLLITLHNFQLWISTQLGNFWQIPCALNQVRLYLVCRERGHVSDGGGSFPRDQGSLSRKETDQPCRWMNERKSKPEEQLPSITVENSFLSARRNNLTVTESAGRQTLGRDTEWRDETACVSIVLSTGSVRQSVSADTEIRDHPSVRRLWLDLMGPWTSENSELPAGLSIEALFIKQDVAKALGLVGKTHPVSVVGIGRVLCEYTSLQLVKF